MKRRTALVSVLVLVGLLTACGSTDSSSQDGLANLRGVEQLRRDFEGNPGKRRLVLLLSPTCPDCIIGASWIQTYLKKHPQPDLRVYAIWFSVLETDAPSKWDRDLLNDPRVNHYWDDDQTLGRWLAQPENGPEGFAPHFAQAGRMVWDTYLLFSTTARWTDTPTGLLSSGGTIIGTVDRLQAALDQPTTP